MKYWFLTVLLVCVGSVSPVHSESGPIGSTYDNVVVYEADKIITMETSHSPFFAAPEELAKHLLSI